jgi:hypothetical protein
MGSDTEAEEDNPSTEMGRPGGFHTRQGTGKSARGGFSRDAAEERADELDTGIFALDDLGLAGAIGGAATLLTGVPLFSLESAATKVTTTLIDKAAGTQRYFNPAAEKVKGLLSSSDARAETALSKGAGTPSGRGARRMTYSPPHDPGKQYGSDFGEDADPFSGEKRPAAAKPAVTQVSPTQVTSPFDEERKSRVKTFRRQSLLAPGNYGGGF